MGSVTGSKRSADLSFNREIRLAILAPAVLALAVLALGLLMRSSDPMRLSVLAGPVLLAVAVAVIASGLLTRHLERRFDQFGRRLEERADERVAAVEA